MHIYECVCVCVIGTESPCWFGRWLATLALPYQQHTSENHYIGSASVRAAETSRWFILFKFLYDWRNFLSFQLTRKVSGQFRSWGFVRTSHLIWGWKVVVRRGSGRRSQLLSCCICCHRCSSSAGRHHVPHLVLLQLLLFLILLWRILLLLFLLRLQEQLQGLQSLYVCLHLLQGHRLPLQGLRLLRRGIPQLLTSPPWKETLKKNRRDGRIDRVTHSLLSGGSPLPLTAVAAATKLLLLLLLQGQRSPGLHAGVAVGLDSEVKN